MLLIKTENNTVEFLNFSNKNQVSINNIHIVPTLYNYFTD